MEKFLVDQILKIVSDISLYMDNVQQMSGTRKITEYLNIEHSMGKYHAFMECLEESNLDEFTRIYDLTNQKTNDALKKLEEIYQYMRQ